MAHYTHLVTFTRTRADGPLAGLAMPGQTLRIHASMIGRTITAFTAHPEISKVRVERIDDDLDALNACNACEAAPADPDSPAGYCAPCEREARAQ